MPENKQDLKISTINIDELIASEYNPRKWSESAIEALKESIERFGLIDPILANDAENRKNIVIGGHFRLKVAKDLGLRERFSSFGNLLHNIFLKTW